MILCSISFHFHVLLPALLQVNLIYLWILTAFLSFIHVIDVFTILSFLFHTQAIFVFLSLNFRFFDLLILILKFYNAINLFLDCKAALFVFQLLLRSLEAQLLSVNFYYAVQFHLLFLNILDLLKYQFMKGYYVHQDYDLFSIELDFNYYSYMHYFHLENKIYWDLFLGHEIN